MFIRTSVLLAVIMLAGAAAASAQQGGSGAAQNGAGGQRGLKLAVEISTVGDKFLRKPKSIYKAGEGVFVQLSLTNETGEDVTIAAGDPLEHLRLSLTKDGKKVAFNKKTRERLDPERERGISHTVAAITLKPFTTTPTEVISLGEWFDTLEPGTYQLTVWRVWGKGHKSNTVTFDVVP